MDYGLVIEVDGSQHFEDKGKEQDKLRDEYIKSLGFNVLRFSNLEVMSNLSGVVEEIKKTLR